MFRKKFNTIYSPHEVLREIPIDCLLHHGRPGKSTGERKGGEVVKTVVVCCHTFWEPSHFRPAARTNVASESR